VKATALTAADVAAAVARLRPSGAQDAAVAEVVSWLVEQVRSKGDAGLVEATARLDWPGATVAGLRVPAADLAAAAYDLEDDLRAALELARDNCRWFHEHELRASWEEAGSQGQLLGIRYLPVGRAGLYVPGGLGSYASSVIMNAVPAQVAGVTSLFICTPPARDGSVNASVLAAAHLLGVDEVYRVGGAQAIAAMAYGTESIRRADVISGPGNAYVTEAKRQVSGVVGIDGLAGPSEVVVVAAADCDPRWAAADLLAQEEHGSGASAVLVAESAEVCAGVASEVERLRDEYGRGGSSGSGDGSAPGRGSASGGGPPSGGALHAFFPASGEPFQELAVAFVNEYAPEHLEIHLRDPRAFLDRVQAAGAVFVGAHTPTAFGDYVAGSNHVLPTGGAARFSSALSVDTFVRRMSVIEVPPDAARLLTPPLARIAQSEGFGFHRISAEQRSGRA